MCSTELDFIWCGDVIAGGYHPAAAAKALRPDPIYAPLHEIIDVVDIDLIRDEVGYDAKYFPIQQYRFWLNLKVW